MRGRAQLLTWADTEEWHPLCVLRPAWAADSWISANQPQTTAELCVCVGLIWGGWCCEIEWLSSLLPAAAAAVVVAVSTGREQPSLDVSVLVCSMLLVQLWATTLTAMCLCVFASWFITPIRQPTTIYIYIYIMLKYNNTCTQKYAQWMRTASTVEHWGSKTVPYADFDPCSHQRSTLLIGNVASSLSLSLSTYLSSLSNCVRLSSLIVHPLHTETILTVSVLCISGKQTTPSAAHFNNFWQTFSWRMFAVTLSIPASPH